MSGYLQSVQHSPSGATCISALGVDAALFYSPVLQLLFTDFCLRLVWDLSED